MTALLSMVIILPMVFIRSFLAAALGLLLVACPHLENYTAKNEPRYSGSYSTKQSIPRETLTALSFNIQFSNNIEQAIAELKGQGFAYLDVVLLQEMDNDGVDAIARALEMNYVYYPASIHTNGKDFGNAVLSPWPIVTDEKILLPHKNPKNGQRRIAVSAQLLIGDEPVNVYSVHTETLWLSMSKRLNQLRYVLERVPEQQRAIVGGDFNTSDGWIKALTIGQAEDAGFLQATGGIGGTVSAGPFSPQLDHLFTRGFERLNAGTIATSQASDHLPIWAELHYQPQFYAVAGFN